MVERIGMTMDHSPDREAIVIRPSLSNACKVDTICEQLRAKKLLDVTESGRDVHHG